MGDQYSAEPLLFRPLVAPSLTGVALLSGVIGLAAGDNAIGPPVAFSLGCAYLFGIIASLAIPVSTEAEREGH